MLLRSLVVVGLVGLSLAFDAATAEDAGTQAQFTSAVSGVSFVDIGDTSPPFDSRTLTLRTSPQSVDEIPASLTNDGSITAPPSSRQVEVALTQNAVGGSPLDIEFAQRASLGFDNQGDLQSSHHGHEVRVGQNLGRRLGQTFGISQWRGGAGSWDHPTWYLFAASDSDAIALRGGRITLQEHVYVGDVAAGLTMERGPLRASLAYVERETSLQMYRKTSRADQHFTGITVSWRH